MSEAQQAEGIIELDEEIWAQAVDAVYALGQLGYLTEVNPSDEDQMGEVISQVYLVLEEFSTQRAIEQLEEKGWKLVSIDGYNVVQAA